MNKVKRRPVSRKTRSKKIVTRKRISPKPPRGPGSVLVRNCQFTSGDIGPIELAESSKGILFELASAVHANAKATRQNAKAIQGISSVLTASNVTVNQGPGLAVYALPEKRGNEISKA